MSLSHGQNASVVGVVVVVGGGDTARDATRRRVDPPWHVASTYMEVSFNTTIDGKTAMIGQEFLRSSVPFFVFSICFFRTRLARLKIVSLKWACLCQQSPLDREWCVI